jgi:hypothetical protein
MGVCVTAYEACGVWRVVVCGMWYVSVKYKAHFAAHHLEANAECHIKTK